MIVGIGVDLIEIERVKRACAKQAFLDKIFTKIEQTLIQADLKKAAGNFAVKEAVVKAFGTGFGKVSPREIEVLRDDMGKPYVVLYGEAKKIALERNVQALHVSISNTKEYVTAFAVGECQ